MWKVHLDLVIQFLFIIMGKKLDVVFINYSVDDMKAIKGHNTNDIAQILGINTTYDEAIHRNNLVLLH